MKLSQKAISQIRINKRLKNRLAFELDKSPGCIQRNLDENKENALLTTTLAVAIIQEELSIDSSEILEEHKQVA